MFSPTPTRPSRLPLLAYASAVLSLLLIGAWLYAQPGLPIAQLVLGMGLLQCGGLAFLLWRRRGARPLAGAPLLASAPAAMEPRIKAEALQNAIFNSANFSSIATDAQGVIQIFNVGAERMLATWRPTWSTASRRPIFPSPTRWWRAPRT